MTTLVWEVPEGSDFWPCPEGCGGPTEDAAGGPCKRCWARAGNGRSCGCELCQSGEAHYDARCPTCDQVVPVARGIYATHWADPYDLRSRWCSNSGMEAS